MRIQGTPQCLVYKGIGPLAFEEEERCGRLEAGQYKTTISQRKGFD